MISAGYVSRAVFSVRLLLPGIMLFFSFFIGPVLAGFLIVGCAQQYHSVAKTSANPYPRDLTHGPKYYHVKKGDTLYAIGLRSGQGYQRLAEWNGIQPPYHIRVGQTIKLFKPVNVSMPTKPVSKQPQPVQKKRNSAHKKSSISNNNKKMLKLYWQWPIRGRILTTFSQSGNKGIDIQGVTGQSVKAAAKGKVVYSGNGLIGYGNLLIIKHSEQYLSAYAYNRRLLVKEGQWVKSGQIIAEVGKGSGNRNSLHFEIRKNGKPVNPVNYLPK